MIEYAGKVALVTGGASGIGAALAAALRMRGATVIVADIQQPADIICDLAEPAAAGSIVTDVFATHGRLDLLCSNAGIGRNKRLLKEPLEAGALTRLFEINLFSALRFAQAYVARLKDSGGRGRLMITGSENSLSTPSAVKGAGLGLYAATKHGVLIAAEWLRDEVEASAAPLDLHVLLPGSVYTPLVAKSLPDPAAAPAALDLIMPERCAAIALDGMDKGLFYIPTQPHLFDDMAARHEAIRASVEALGLRR